MNLRKLWTLGFSFCVLALTALLVVGCVTTPTYEVPDYNPPPVDGGPERTDKLKIGDTVRVEYISFSERQIPPHEEQIKDDGSITLTYVGKVNAAGKTTGELQKELQTAYARYFKNLTIVVKSPDRYYSVGGEVKLPNRFVYVGGTTVIKAIQSAGDLTDFANRKRIQLTRSNGKTYTIDYTKALSNPSLDLPVYPGDSIHVPRRFL